MRWGVQTLTQHLARPLHACAVQEAAGAGGALPAAHAVGAGAANTPRTAASYSRPLYQQLPPGDCEDKRSVQPEPRPQEVCRSLPGILRVAAARRD